MKNEDKPKGQSNLEKKESSKSDVQYISLNISGIDEKTEEIDVYDLLKTINNRRTILVNTLLIFLALGLIVAILSNEEYTTNVKLLPESQSELPLGRLGSLATQFGFSVAPQASGDILAANLYPDIIKSNAFIVELMDYEVTLANNSQKLPLKVYIDDYQNKSYLKQLITIAVTLKNWVTDESENELSNIDKAFSDQDKINRLIEMSKEDWEILRDIKDRITTILDNETGIVSVSVKMQDPLVAADIADEIVQMLSDYIIDNRTKKARRDAEFVEERFKEAKIQFEQAQRELAEFNDANRGQLTALAKTEEQLLQSRYNLKFNLYNSMAERLEEARIKLQEDTPVINIMEPAAVPDKKSEPNRILILIMFSGFGVFIGVLLIYGLKFWSSFKKSLI